MAEKGEKRGGENSLDWKVRVKFEGHRGGYRILYVARSPQRHTKAVRSFLYNISSSSESKRGMIDEVLIKNLMLRILNEKPEAVLWRRKPNEIRAELVHYINRIMRSSKRGKYLKEFGFGERGRNKQEKEDEEVDPKQHQDEPLPKKSMFTAEKESANTKVFLAPSFSGKTTLMVEELNKLARKELEEYDKIILFTESTASAPLKKLDKKVREKMLIYDRFVPQFVKVLKKINTVCNNIYKFL
jgi:hypothetical protein